MANKKNHDHALHVRVDARHHPPAGGVGRLCSP